MAPSLAQTNSRPSARSVLGRTEPRYCTPPLRELTPETSAGFAQIRFARDVLRHPLDPWQEFAVIHAGERLEDGSPRFRIVLLLVARQQGKTELISVLASYWLAVDASPMVLGMNVKVEYARETWDKTRKLIEAAPALAADLDRRWSVQGNNRIEMWLRNGARYKVAASTEEGPRTLTVDKLLMDEFRHTDVKTWEAAEGTTVSVDDSQIWCTSNAGDGRSTLLNEMRDAAVKFIETGEGDDSVLLLEWSAPEDADPTDIEALAMANPNLGRRTRADRMLARARTAVAAGGATLASFKTNYMCQRVKVSNPAIDPGAWLRRLDAALRPAATDTRRALCLDVALDGGHVTLASATVLADDRVMVGIVGAWDSTAAARRALPALLAGAKSKTIGWFPGGPGAQLAADLADRSTAQRINRPAALPPGMKSEEIRGEVGAVCMGFEELVRSGLLVHPGDMMLDEQVGAAERMKTGNTWVFARSGEVYVDALYAVSGAAHLARTMPPPVGKPRLLTAA
jgi:hypothetical protein